MRIVSTISPQPSDEQLSTLQGIHSETEETEPSTNDSDDMRLPQSNLSDETEQAKGDLETQQSNSEGSVPPGTALSGTVCRSYKEVCIYGNNSSVNSTSNSSDQTGDKTSNENTRANGSK